MNVKKSPVRKSVRYAGLFIKEKSVHKTYESYTTIVVEIRDPAHLLSCVLSVVVNREWVAITTDHSLPQSELIDRAIVDIEMISDPLITDELRSMHESHSLYNCACCASDISTGEHNGGYGGHVSCFRTPLSAKIVAFLVEYGHTFAHDPAIAQRAEREAWQQLRIQQVNSMWD